MTDYSWILHVYKHQVDPAQVDSPDGLPLCCGQYDLQYIEMLRAKKGKIVAVRRLDDGAQLFLKLFLKQFDHRSVNTWRT